MNKILISDYDKTFYISDEDIEKNKIAVKEFRKAGNIFIIATGRNYLDFMNKVNLYNFEYDYVILDHGATIIDKENKVFSSFKIDNSIISSLKEDLQLEDAIKYFCSSDLDSRVDFDYRDLTKIYVKYNSIEVPEKLHDIIVSKYSNYINCYRVSRQALEMISSQINKSKAIDILLNKYNMDKQNVSTIGDGYSDIEMVRDFNGYAMKNSVEELKKVATKEFESVSELVYELINYKDRSNSFEREI